MKLLKLASDFKSNDQDLLEVQNLSFKGFSKMIALYDLYTLLQRRQREWTVN